MTLVYLGLGSNQNRHQNIGSGLQALEKLLGTLQISPVYESKSVGFDGSNFFNLVVAAETSLSLSDLSQRLKKIEDDHGRIRKGAKFSPRSLDIDILLYGDTVGTEAGVQLPREEITENAFVLLPLSQIAPHKLHPTLKKTYAELWQSYDQQSQALWQINFN